jgi:hypothetical protein
MSGTDDAMFDPATYNANGIPPGLLAQMFATPGASAGWPASAGGGSMMPVPVPPAPSLPPPVDVGYPPGGIPPSGPMSSGDGGALMPVPMPPASPGPSHAAVAGAYGSDQVQAAVPPASLLGRIRDLLQKGHEWAGDNRSTLMALGAGRLAHKASGKG